MAEPYLDLKTLEDVKTNTPQPSSPQFYKKRKLIKSPRADTFTISARVRKWAAEHGYTRLEERLEHFIGYCRAHGRMYADWDQAFMNAIRDNWAKLNKSNDAGDAQVSPTLPPSPSERFQKQLQTATPQTGGIQ